MKEYALIKKKYLLVPVILFDTLGSLGVRFFARLNPVTQPKKLSRILLVRLDHMGDVIMSTPVIRVLNDFLPGTQIDFAVASWAADIVRYNLRLNNIIIFDPAWFDFTSDATPEDVKPSVPWDEPVEG